jgi:hypothetical protein
MSHTLTLLVADPPAGRPSSERFLTALPQIVGDPPLTHTRGSLSSIHNP